MKVLTYEEIELLDILIKSELEIIEKGFCISELMGKLFLQNAITDFKENYLKKRYGDIIPALSTEYRYFILGLLKEIKDEYRDITTRFILVPEFGNISTEELIKFLNLKNK